MQTRALTLMLGIVLTLGAAGVGDAAPPIALPALTRIASKLSGLQATRSVRLVSESDSGMRQQAQRLLDRDYPPDQQAYDQTVYRALGVLAPGEALRPPLLATATRDVLGLYDTLGQTLYVRNGTGSSHKTAVLHELVHALQDQAFDLRRLSALRRGDRDAALAASASVEGDAQLATQLVGNGRIVSVVHTRRLATPAGDRIALFLELEQQFPYTTGLRFVSTLHNLGGSSAVFGALRRFPTTTEQIFHVDAYLAHEPAAPVSLPPSAAGFSLRRADTFGELDARALLAIFQIPRLDQVGDGWGGGRSGIYADAAGHQAVVLDLSWDTDLDAAQWAEAVATYVNEAFDAEVPGLPATTPCAATTCWTVSGRSIAFVRRGERTALVFGPGIDSAAALAMSAVA